MNMSKLETLWKKKQKLKNKLKIKDEEILRKKLKIEENEKQIPLEKIQDFFSESDNKDILLLLNIRDNKVDYEDIKALFEENTFQDTMSRIQKKARLRAPLTQRDSKEAEDRLSTTLPLDIFSKENFEITKAKKYESSSRMWGDSSKAAKRILDTKIFTTHNKKTNLQFFRIFDKNCDGLVTKQDFCDVLHAKDILDKQDSGKLFDNLKKKNDNFLEAGEFERLIYSGFSSKDEVKSLTPNPGYTGKLKNIIKTARMTRGLVTEKRHKQINKSKSLKS